MSGSSAQNRPLISVKLHLRDGDIRRLHEALGRAIERNPNIKIALDADLQEISICGTDETQVELVIAGIRRGSGLLLEVGESEVIYLESICGTAEAGSKYIRQTGGSGNYAHVELRLEPIDPEVVAFVADDNIETIPGKYIAAVEQGVRQAAMRGVQSGNEIVAVRVVLCGGSYHETDSSELAFRIAGATAFNEAVAKAGRVLLEPIMAVEIAVPEEYTKIVQRDFTNRCGRITGLEHHNDAVIIHAIAPLAEMLGYRGPELKMHFLRYAEAPSSSDEYGDREAGVPARPLRGPKPRHGFTTLPEPE